MTLVDATTPTPLAVGLRDTRRVFWRSEPLRALLAALVLGLLYGRVGVAHLGTGLVGGNSNGYENVWNDWWFREALTHLKNPFYTTRIFYPNGVSLRYHTLNPLGGLLALPLGALFGPVAAMNLKFLAAVIGAIFFAWLLFRDAAVSGPAAFAGAAMYALASDQAAYYFKGGAENYLMGTALLPLFVWLALRAATRPRGLPWAAGAVVALLALCLTDWQYTMFATLVVALYALCALCTRRPWQEKARVTLRLAAVGVVWLVIVAVPLLLPMLIEVRNSPWLRVNGQAITLSRALSQFTLPGLGNPGYVALIAGALGLLVWWRRGRTDGPERQERFTVGYWAVVALVGGALSLGPYLKLIPGSTATRVPLPYAAIYNLPVFSVGRRPQLFLFVALLGCGALLAVALRALTDWLREAGASRDAANAPRPPRFPARAWHAVLGPLLAALVLVPTLAPFVADVGGARAYPLAVPPFYRDVLAHDPTPYAILELPLFAESGRGDDWPALETVHGKSVFDGSISRDHSLESPLIFAKQATFFRDAFWLAKPTVRERLRPTRAPDFLATPNYGEMGMPLLHYYHVRYIVLWFAALRSLRSDGVEAADALARQALGANARPVYEDATMRVYQVPDATAQGAPPAPPVFLDTGLVGWYNAERAPDGTGFRWADIRGGAVPELIAWNLSPTRQHARMHLTLTDYTAPRTVHVALNATTSVNTYSLDANATREIVLDFDLLPGMNLVTLASPEPPVPAPAAPGVPKDDRLLGFSVRDIRLL